MKIAYLEDVLATDMLLTLILSIHQAQIFTLKPKQFQQFLSHLDHRLLLLLSFLHIF